MALLYANFQHNWTVTVGGVTRKRKSLQTDRRTDGLFSNGRIIKSFFSFKTHFFRKKKTRKQKRTSTLIFRKIGAFMTCTLYFEETVCKFFSACYMKHCQCFHCFLLWKRSGAIPDSCEIWVSIPGQERVACRSRDRICHQNYNASCLIEYKSNWPLPYQMD